MKTDEEYNKLERDYAQALIEIDTYRMCLANCLNFLKGCNHFYAKVVEYELNRWRKTNDVDNYVDN